MDKYLLIQGHPACRSFLPNLDPRPLAIISIHLSDISAEYLIFNQIKPYYINPAALFIDLKVNFESSVGLECYVHEVEKAVQVLDQSVPYHQTPLS